MAANTILLVSPRGDRLVAARSALERNAQHVLPAGSAREGLGLLARQPVALLLVDEELPAPEREALETALLARDPLARVVPLALPIEGRALLAVVRVALEAHGQLVRLHQAERLKSELLAGVSHELRTPLNVVVGYTELLRDGVFGACSAEATTVLAKVLGNATHLLALVEEFLDLSRAESGGLRSGAERIPLTPFLRELAESFTILVRRKPVAFETDIPDRLPEVLAEPAKLRVVLQNLLANAEKFTERGSIRLSAAALPGERVRIRVTDTGRGIPPEQHEAIFGLFHQLGADAEHRQGVGLGLALARRFARMMAGDVTVESSAGRGSTFTVVLPAVCAEEKSKSIA